MNTTHSQKRYRKQNAARIAMIILSALLIILRIRKMVHLNMIGEETSGLDWLMLALWLFVGILNVIELKIGMRKSPFAQSN